MVIDAAIWLTEQDYNRLKNLLVELTRQSRGIQAGLETPKETLDLALVVHSEGSRECRDHELAGSFSGRAD